MKNQIFMLLVAIISLSACKKSMEVGMAEIKKEAPVKTNMLLEVAGPENPANAYDSIGYWHNEIVGYVQNCKPFSDTPDVALSTSYVRRYCRETNRVELPVAFFATVGQTVRQSHENIRALISGCTYEEPVKAWLVELVNLVQSLSETDNRYRVIWETLAGFEKRVMQDASITTAGRKTVLQASSVARYSTFYWINSPLSPSPGMALRYKNFVRWAAAVTSDVAGAIVSGNAEYAADCSTYAYDLITYGMP